MYHYRRNLMIFSVLLLLLGLLRTVSFVQQMGSWMELFKMDNIDMVKLVLLFLCDLLTSIGAVVSGVMGILLRKKDKGLIVWSILSFVVCIAFFANAMLIIVTSNGQYSNYSSRRGLAYLAALPALQGLCFIGVEKNWEEKMQKNQK